MRYARHISLAEVGEAGQQKLRTAKVLMVGAGGLGSPALQYLAAAGVGTIGIMDADVVSESNLQRQVLYATSDIGKRKVEVAKKKLSALNPDVAVVTFPEMLSAANALDVIRQFDLVIDGTDNFATRYLVNDVCVKLNRPFVYGAIHRFEGQVSVFNFNGGPTYRCLFPDPPAQDQIPNCAETGVLGVLPGVVGTLQATEAMKIILGIGETLSGKLKIVNLLSNAEQIISFSRNEEQVEKAEQIDLVDSYADASCSSENEVGVEQFRSWLEAGKAINVLDVREMHETPKLQHANVISIPLGDVPSRFKELPADKPMVVVCQKGMRSQRAIEFLRENNFQNQLMDLKGGVAAYQAFIDDHPGELNK